MTPVEPLLDVNHLTLRFGGITAVNDVSFQVMPKEFFAIIGPNGAGKTSLFNCLSGIFRPTGSIKVNGHETIHRKPPEIARLGVARTFQNLGLFNSLSPMDNLLIGRHVRMSGGLLAGGFWWGTAKRNERAARLRAHEVVDLLELREHARTPVQQLPYGIRKRVELAKAVAMDPILLLLDEPVAGMNREETEEIVNYVSLLQAQFDLTVLMIEHDVHLVMDIADRVLALDFGEVIGLDVPAEIQKNPRVIEAYLGVGAFDDAIAPQPAAPASITNGDPHHPPSASAGFSDESAKVFP
jgi:branched-chain amino acid transport system ATP-binding protein